MASLQMKVLNKDLFDQLCFHPIQPPEFLHYIFHLFFPKTNKCHYLQRILPNNLKNQNYFECKNIISPQLMNNDLHR